MAKSSPDPIEAQERRDIHRRTFGSAQMQVSPSMDHIALTRQSDDDMGRVTPIDIEFFRTDQQSRSDNPSSPDDTSRYHHSREISMSSFSKSPDLLPR